MNSMRIKTGLCSVTFRKLSVAEIVELCKKLGIEGIEWGGDVHVPPGSPPEQVAEVVELCREAGIEIPSYGSYFDASEHTEKDFAPVLETAVRLGAGTIRIWPGWVEPKDLTDEQFSRIASTARDAAEMASKENVRVAFEYHLDTPTEGARRVLKILEAAGHPNLYSYYQFLEPYDIETNVRNLELIAPRMTYVHCHYYEQEKPLALAEGTAMWSAICGGLKKINYDGFIFMEFVKGGTARQLAEDVAVLRDLLKG
ncbi:MAG: sugar phosphate isomerase/epimerase family protein [Gemmatimonadota bacterium]|nr:sugar phosphate isomerase/epimerase family protein [Gemmatimonadota bacterium]